MADFDAEAHVLSVFKEKCRRAGGLKPGYNLRRQSVLYSAPEVEHAACDGAIASLVERGFLMGNEPGDRLVLTEDGAAALSG